MIGRLCLPVARGARDQRAGAKRAARVGRVQSNSNLVRLRAEARDWELNWNNKIKRLRRPPLRNGCPNDRPTDRPGRFRLSRVGLVIENRGARACGLGDGKIKIYFNSFFSLSLDARIAQRKLELGGYPVSSCHPMARLIRLNRTWPAARQNGIS